MSLSNFQCRQGFATAKEALAEIDKINAIFLLKYKKFPKFDLFYGEKTITGEKKSQNKVIRYINLYYDNTDTQAKIDVDLFRQL